MTQTLAPKLIGLAAIADGMSMQHHHTLHERPRANFLQQSRLANATLPADFTSVTYPLHPCGLTLTATVPVVAVLRCIDTLFLGFVLYTPDTRVAGITNVPVDCVRSILLNTPIT